MRGGGEKMKEWRNKVGGEGKSASRNVREPVGNFLGGGGR